MKTEAFWIEFGFLELKLTLQMMTGISSNFFDASFYAFIAFNCHKFSFFPFVNCLLTALKRKIADNQPLP
jgi:hypothetical protein